MNPRVVVSAMKRDEYGDHDVTWPEGWPVPRVGDDLSLQDGTGLKIKAVDWYPMGEGDDPTPFVYVVAR